MYTIQNDYHAVHHSGTRTDSDVKWLVLHSMESTNQTGAAEGAGSWFENQASGGSTQYGIDNNSIQRYLPDNVICWGAPGPPNDHGLHIEQMGTASWSRTQWMEKAKETLDRTAWLMARKSIKFDIPLRVLTVADLKAGKKGVVTHSTCTKAFGGSHTDPGSGYPIGWVMDRAREYKRKMLDK